MARINRTDVIQKAVNDLALSLQEGKIPSEVLDKVQCVYSLNKQFSNFSLNAQSTASGTLSLTMPSVSAGGEIYLTKMSLSIAKDATCDIATGRIGLNATLDSGISQEILQIAVLTLTADAQTVVVTFPYPLKIKNGTAITSGATFTVGSLSKAFNVSGFITTSN